MYAEPAWVQNVFACIRQAESGGDRTAVNSSSGDNGLYQFSGSTWAANGGDQFASEARYATVAQQNTVAAWTYNADGFNPWAADSRCWG